MTGHPSVPAGGPLILAVVVGAQFMVVIDETVVNVALPSIRASLDLDNGQLAWVVNAYLLFFGGFLLLAGRLADLVGRRRLFLAGLTLFTIASLAAGYAGDESTLIFARAAQGLGGAMLSPAALSILTTTYRDPAPRRRALAAWAATLGLGATLGVLLGGVIVEYLSWHWIFWVNGPVGVLLFAACLLLVPDHRPARLAAALTHRVDLPGAILITAAGLLLVYTVIRTDGRGWGSPATLAGLAGNGLIALASIAWAGHTPRPLIPGAVLRRRAAIAYPMAALTASALFGMFFFLTLHMQVVLGWSALRTGLAWAPHGATVALVSGVAVALVPRVGARALSAAGLLMAAVAQLLLTRITVDGSYRQLLPALLLNGAGLGLAMVPLMSVAVSGMRDEHQGIASGAVNAAQQLGGAVGLAALVSVVAGRVADGFRDAAGGGPAEQVLARASVDAFHTGFSVGAALLVVTAAMTVLLPRVRGRVDMADLV